jgi:hypothetical protein
LKTSSCTVKNDKAEMEGIKGGLDIKGTGTFKFHIKDDEGEVHLMKIPNSKYVPDLKMCLLAPHHWAQETKDHSLSRKEQRRKQIRKS